MVESTGELNAVRERLKKADMQTFDDGETTCCYAKSDKTWVEDPSGIAWETYRTMDDADIFSDAASKETACCTSKAIEAGQGRCC